MNQTTLDLATILSQVLKQLREENGFVLPVQVIVIGACGSVLCVEYIQDEDGEVATEHVAERLRPPGFTMPINILLVDSRGEAGRVRFGGGPANVQRLN